jgi:hypothetical protein
LPSAFTGFVSGISVVNLNLAKALPIGCIRPYTFIDQLVATTLFPILLTGLIYALFLLENLCVTRYIHSTETRKHKLNLIFNKYLNYFFYLTYLVLPSVTTTIFQIFICTNVDPDRYNTPVTLYSIQYTVYMYVCIHDIPPVRP